MASEWFWGRPTRQFEYCLRRSISMGSSFSPYNSTTSVVKFFIGANALVFGGWYLGESTRNTKLLRTLTDNFTLSLRNLKESRPWVLITSAFSHRDLVHIGFNMINLWTFGTILGYMGVGGLHTTAMFLMSGVAGSACWAYHHAFIRPGAEQNHIFSGKVIRAKDLDTALGASGIVMGAASAAACLAPFAPMRFFFIPINVPLWGIAVGYFLIDTYYLNTGTRFGHAAHMGGAAAGVAYYGLFLRRYGGIWRMITRR